MKKKIVNNYANDIYAWAMTESPPYDDIDMWQGHPDCYIEKLEYNLNKDFDSDIGYFIEFDFKYPDERKTKIKEVFIGS